VIRVERNLLNQKRYNDSNTPGRYAPGDFFVMRHKGPEKMNNDLYISLNDSLPFVVTDKDEQEAMIQKLKIASSEINENAPNQIIRAFTRDSVDAGITNAVLSGLSWPAVITSVGYLLKHLSPIIIEFMKVRAQKEISIEVKGVKMTVKGGGNFEDDLNKLISKIESLDQKESTE
jgi:hypothetical protein